MKDDSGSQVSFIEQGSSSSQMTTTKVMDVIAALPDCAGQAADAVSAYTQVKIEDAPKLVKNLVRMSRFMDTSSKSWSNIEDRVVLLERNFNGEFFFCRFLVRERQSETVLLVLGWEISHWNVRLFMKKQEG